MEAQPVHEHVIRIVRLTLAPERLDDFMYMFNNIKSRIRNTAGCLHLELLQDTRFPNIVTTYSHWDNESALNAYRDSAFFKEVWPATKDMFAAPPVAFSSRQVHVLP